MAKRQNIQAGYYDQHGFHPIRWSKDYDPDRAGDDYSVGTDNRGLKKRKKKNMRRKSNPDSGMLMVLLIGGAGLAYWWYTTQSTTSALPSGVPSTATTYYAAGGGTAAAPKVGDAYLNSAGNVVAVFGTNGWATYTGTTAITAAQYTQLLQNAAASAAGTTAGATTTTSTTATPVTSGGVNQPATTGPMSLATLLSNMQATMTAANDPAITYSGGTFSATPYVFNYYLALPSVNGNSSTIPTTVDGANLSTLFPGANPNNAMTLSTYWAGMSAYLGSSLGMSGLRGFAGLGFQPRSPYFNAVHGGWRV
jgi:hypothetical protein